MCGLALTVVTTRSRSDPVLDKIQFDNRVVQASASTSDGAATGAAMSPAVQRKLGFRFGGNFLVMDNPRAWAYSFSLSLGLSQRGPHIRLGTSKAKTNVHTSFGVNCTVLIDEGGPMSGFRVQGCYK